MESELFIVVCLCLLISCVSIELGLPLIIMPDYKRCLYFKGAWSVLVERRRPP